MTTSLQRPAQPVDSGAVRALVAEYRKAAVFYGKYRGRAQEQAALARRTAAVRAVAAEGHPRLGHLLMGERRALRELAREMGDVAGQDVPAGLDAALMAAAEARVAVEQYVRNFADIPC